jgi:DNA repair exonuclease SbcCD ATPase subunit
MDLIKNKIKDLAAQIEALDELIRTTRKEQCWDLINQLIEEVQLLEKEYDELTNIVRRQEELQEIEDFYDDEKNRDAYTMLIIESQFADVIS